MNVERHYLFLQGMPCRFFSQVGAGLRARGARVSSIHLSLGDWLFWQGPGGVSYRGSYSDWAGFVAAWMHDQRVTDLVLLGEQRRYHKEAVAVAHAQGVRVSVTDFGYLRPDWITLERDGMGGNSHFPRDASEIRRQAATLTEADLSPRYTDSALNMAIGDLVYSFANVLFCWLYPRYRRSDCRPASLVYFPAMGWRLLRARARDRRAAQVWQALREQPAIHFVLPLQLEHDFQIVAYSPYGTQLEALAEIMASFTRAAPATARLLVKVHPWDPGLVPWHREIARIAGEFGLRGRVHFLDGGNLDDMLHRARGVVTVNSTSGLRALVLGIPVKTLGQAVYDVPGLTWRGPLDDFWQQPEKPDAGLLQAFLNLLSAAYQVRGVFFTGPGRSAAAQEMVERLDQMRVGVP